jgi:hypothetical protein
MGQVDRLRCAPSTSSDVPSSDVPSSDASQTNLWSSRFDTPSGDQSRRGTPVNSDSEDQEETTEDQKRKSGPAQPPRSSTPVSGIVESVAQKVQPPRPATPVAPSGISVPSDPPSPKKGKGKAAIKPKAAAPLNGSGQKAATRPAVPEGPHPMTTRQKASRAGSLRDGGGSRATDTRVANGNHSGT